MKADIENAETSEPSKVEPSSPEGAQDEVDFSSGFEKQYQKEYRPLERPVVQPPEKDITWYRDFTTILMIIFLAGIFIIGSVLLFVQFFTPNPIKILLLVGAYVIIAIFVIILEAKSGHVR